MEAIGICPWDCMNEVYFVDRGIQLPGHTVNRGIQLTEAGDTVNRRIQLTEAYNHPGI